jgi:hypothetical protein
MAFAPEIITSPAPLLKRAALTRSSAVNKFFIYHPGSNWRRETLRAVRTAENSIKVE